MFKLFPIAFYFATLFPVSHSLQDNNNTEQEEKVKSTVVAWADEVFLEHASYKFENFHAEQSDEFFIQASRIEM